MVWPAVTFVFNRSKRESPCTTRWFLSTIGPSVRYRPSTRVSATNCNSPVATWRRGIGLQDALDAAARYAHVETTFAEPQHELVWLPQKDGTANLAWDVTVFGLEPRLVIT